ncbi:hypothetical protein M885DRAFT_525785 [Pelagophyceae sp. CCMP2097]|nr:hypothetical protein M885DRAFT_525785 [Pelagophyceae sp. CCMP2097]|mmetsp:Transcript_9666/g.33997  ORF Transcript_9666/g.33997 Transcript_9666/m.33997 type:complete len:302 (+) Transcript_9666:52-957(+)
MCKPTGMHASKTALALPPKLEDYPPGNALLTAWMVGVVLWGWVASWAAQVVFTYTFGLGMVKSRLEFWNGKIFRTLSARSLPALTPGVSVQVTKDSWKPEQAHLDGKVGLMVVANHRSFMDPYAVGSALAPLETKYVAKGDLFDVPFGGWAMQRAGDLAVKYDPKKNDGWGAVKGATGQLLHKAAEQLEAGNSICIFPEGTRMGFCPTRAAEAAAHPSKLMPFKAPFFDVAKKLDVGVVCCAVKGTDDILPLGSNLFRPAVVRVKLSAPMFGRDYADEDKFADAVRLQVGTMYQDLCRDYP